MCGRKVAKMTKKKTTKRKGAQCYMECKFFDERLPDFRYLGSHEFKNTTLDKLRRSKYAQDEDDVPDVLLPMQEGNVEHSMIFGLVSAKDVQKALDLLLRLLHRKINASVEFLYQVYGDRDFVVQLIGEQQELDKAKELINGELKRQTLLRPKRPKWLNVSKTYRHWGLELGTEDKAVWFVNADKYKAIRAIIHVKPGDDYLDNPDFPMLFTEELKRSLNYPIVTDSNGDGNGVHGLAIRMITGIYFDEDGYGILTLLCPCGLYYAINKITDQIDRFCAIKSFGGTTTYLVAGIPTFTPHKTSLARDLAKDESLFVRDIITFLYGTNEIQLGDFRVFGKYFRYLPDVRKGMKDFVNKVCKAKGSLMTKDQPSTPIFFLWGDSGVGKTYLFEQLFYNDPKAPTNKKLQKIDLAATESKKVWTDNLSSWVNNNNAICIFDEADDTSTEEKCSLGELFKRIKIIEDRIKKKRTNVPICVFMGSCGTGLKDFEKTLRVREKGKDIFTRRMGDYALPTLTPEDLILVVLMSAFSLKKKKTRVEKILILKIINDVISSSQPSMRRVSEAANQLLSKSKNTSNELSSEDCMSVDEISQLKIIRPEETRLIGEYIDVDDEPKYYA